MAMVTALRDPELVQQMLASGQLTTTDAQTGYHRSLYADCPGDGQPAAVWRIVRGERGAITEITMRCARCGREFVASPATLYLR
jgi:hypothetical protein